MSRHTLEEKEGSVSQDTPWVTLKFIGDSYANSWVRLQAGDEVLTSPARARQWLKDFPMWFEALV